MNRKQKKILAAIIVTPTSGSLKFADIENLFVSMGAKIKEGRGSRVAFIFQNGTKWEEHRPHPQKEAKKYQVESARRVLQKLGYGNE